MVWMDHCELTLGMDAFVPRDDLMDSISVAETAASMLEHWLARLPLRAGTCMPAMAVSVWSCQIISRRMWISTPVMVISVWTCQSPSRDGSVGTIFVGN